MSVGDARLRCELALEKLDGFEWSEGSAAAMTRVFEVLKDILAAVEYLADAASEEDAS